MPFQAQRFIHAANVRLDVPVSVYLSEKLTDELRHQLEDATLLSFDCVIDNCIDRQVDYLLLSGNLFVESDRSLRARMALLRGFRRLEQNGINVFVLPGDTDPPEAWRAIPELPENVHVCLSSNPEPIALERDGRPITTVSTSMWYGETDAFGIRVIHSSADGVEPFRIGTVTRAKYDEFQRMAALTTSAEDKLVSFEDDQPSPSATVDTTADDNADPASADEAAEAGFRAYIQKLMREGRLNYLALGSEIDRTDMELETGTVHCPGTTQPRSQMEADCGMCSLVTVDASGNVHSLGINTSAVDWKNISLELTPGTDLNHLLELMRETLLDTSCSPSDRLWSVCWTLTGPLPVLHEFVEDDLELAVTVELDELDVSGQAIRLLHQVRLLPDAWELDDSEHLAQQYAELIPQGTEHDRDELIRILEDVNLSEGWGKRLEALTDGVNSERLLAQLRNDGAEWFVPDTADLLPPELEPEPLSAEAPMIDPTEISSQDSEADQIAESDSPIATAVLEDAPEAAEEMQEDQVEDSDETEPTEPAS